MNHPCQNKCTNFKDEPCHKCLIEQIERREFELGLAPDDAYVKTAQSFSAAMDELIEDIFEGDHLHE